MLNKDNQRELVYVVAIDKIEPIPNADKVELAYVGGWHIMVRKGQFKVGDPAIYFEIDSKVPEKEPFEFLAPKHYKVKTQKFIKGTVISQGLLMTAEDFGWEIYVNQKTNQKGILDTKGKLHLIDDESRFLTKQLEVTYADAADQKRKSSPSDKYKKMASRHPKIFKKKPIRWLMKHTWGKKLLFLFFGKKKGGWPSWVQKTDEERCQNMPWLFTDEQWKNTRWLVTEKIDGTSTTFTLKRKKRNKFEYHVCSRNVCFDLPEKRDNCFYDTNVYLEMSEKYHIEEALIKLFDVFNDCGVEFITLQGETYGDGIQKRTYSLNSHRFAAFNLILGFQSGTRRRLNTIEMKQFLNKLPMHIPTVPIVEEDFVLPATCEELLQYAEGTSVLDDKEREGVVIRDYEGERSFKAVSNSFLMKYHG